MAPFNYGDKENLTSATNCNNNQPLYETSNQSYLNYLTTENNGNVSIFLLKLPKTNSSKTFELFFAG